MKYQFKTKPYKHQVDAIKKLIQRPRGGALFMEMGTGKTKTAIDYACILELRQEISQVLVLGPLSTLGVWDKEVKLHSTSKSLKWRVLNYDKARMPHYLRQLIDYMESAPTLFICDEGHRLKNPSTKQSKAALVLGKRARRTLILTGTPIAKHPLDLFGEMRVIDENILGSSYGVFKKTYALWGGYGGYQLIKYINLKRLMSRVEPHIFVARKDECLDLPKRTHEVIPVTLKASRPVYRQMAKESIAELESGDISEAPIVLTRMLRLSQITGGYLRTEDGYVQVGTEKAQRFDELLEEMNEQDVSKVVVFVRFLNELRDVAKIAINRGYKVLPFHGEVPATKREELLCEFDETDEATVFVAQISAGSLGISLTAANVAIFYSHTYNFAEFAQACDRLHRIGQYRPVTYYHLLAEDTIDEAVWLSLRTKRALADIVLSRSELLI